MLIPLTLNFISELPEKKYLFEKGGTDPGRVQRTTNLIQPLIPQGTKAQRGEVTCSRPQSQLMTKRNWSYPTPGSPSSTLHGPEERTTQILCVEKTNSPCRVRW